MTPASLSDPAARKRLAHLLVWGSQKEERLIERSVIERRIEKVLERIAEKKKGE